MAQQSSGGSITVEPGGQTVTVTLTATTGALPTVYSDEGLTSPVTFPNVISSNATYYVSRDCYATLSCLIGGVESATPTGATYKAILFGGTRTAVRPTAQITAVSGRQSTLAVGSSWSSGATVSAGQVIDGADGYYYVVTAGTTTLGTTSAVADVAASKLVGPIGATSASTELAYAENVTGSNVATTAVSTFVDVTGLSIAVPASARPVYLACAVLVGNSAAQFSMNVQITEVSNGVDTPIKRGRLFGYGASGIFVPVDFICARRTYCSDAHVQGSDRAGRFPGRPADTVLLLDR